MYCIIVAMGWRPKSEINKLNYIWPHFDYTSLYASIGYAWCTSGARRCAFASIPGPSNRHFSLLNVNAAGACGYDFLCDGGRLVRAYVRLRRGAI